MPRCLVTTLPTLRLGPIRAWRTSPGIDQGSNRLGHGFQPGGQGPGGDRDAQAGLFHLATRVDGRAAEVAEGPPTDEIGEEEITQGAGLAGQLTDLAGQLWIAAADGAAGSGLVVVAAGEGQVDPVQQLAQILGGAADAQAGDALGVGLADGMEPSFEVMCRAVSCPALQLR